MNRAILLVGTDESTLRDMEDFFRARGFDVGRAQDLRSAEDALAARRFDLVITDLRLGEDDDGLVIVAAARRRTPPPPVILLTAHGYPELFAIALQLGASHVLDKPQPLPELHRIALELMSQGDDPDRARAGSPTGA